MIDSTHRHLVKKQILERGSQERRTKRPAPSTSRTWQRSSKLVSRSLEAARSATKSVAR